MVDPKRFAYLKDTSKVSTTDHAGIDVSEISLGHETKESWQ